jgi:hypothetical protein
MVVARPDAEWPVGTDVGEVRRFGRGLADSLDGE